MTLTQLEYIVSLDRYRNFSAASQACHVTQPTLSVQIQKLEDLLQVIIFDRSKQPIEPTLLGQKIIEQARVVLQNTSLIKQMILEEAGKVQGDFQLGIIPSVAGSLIPLFLKSFTEQFPQVKLTILELETNELIKKLNKDEIDAGIAATPLLERNLTEHPLYWEPFYLFVNKKHELYGKDKIQQGELHKQNVLLMSEGNCIRTQVSQICKMKKHFDNDKSIEFESSSFHTLIQLVQQNMGMTLLPHLVASNLGPQKSMLRPFSGKTPTREIALITKRTLVKKTITDAISEIIRNSVPQELLQRDNKNSRIVSPL